ncbi:MAG TPA: hypothetical protein VNA22_05525 [Pyrinomonadaceae bacterium]|nr:hypothetical protein [Pyrinomonadaceae bacterium]
MNSEELERSLRTEFENYLKGVFAEMRQDVADFQNNFASEFEKHKSQMDERFQNLSARFESDLTFDKAFTESVIEHLRLARDDGAELTAKAFADAQDLESGTPAPANYDILRDAIRDISGQLTQAAILKSLVDNASRFTPRGAFFIVKHDNFVCWRKFDESGHSDDDAVRSIHVSVQADTVLADAVRTLGTRDNSGSQYADDSQYLSTLSFGSPDRMYAIPLLARGRAVAVLYADRGTHNGLVNVEAIESLVRVAGLTVELRAASVSAQPAAVQAPAYVPMHEQPRQETVDEESSYAEPVEEESVDHEAATPDVTGEYADTAVSASDYSEPSYASEEYAEPAYASEEQSQPAADSQEYHEEYVGAVAVEDAAEPVTVVTAEDAGYFASPEAETEEPASEPDYENSTPGTAPPETVNDFAFTSSDSYDASAEAELEPVEEYAYAGEISNGSNGQSYEAAPEPVVEVAVAQPAKSRLSDRHVDLPIEVSDGERRLHNDARRFARLLVSEIKLYNEQKVHEGRDAADLYDRLREAIERSREMYDKRVRPEVAAKFDYFHYELVSNLAEGNDAKLGASYPGATV